MAQSAVHILEDGTIEKCRRFRSVLFACERQPHWETVRAAEIFLDNKAYLAERAATIKEFTDTERNFSHPRRIHVTFPADKWGNLTVRKFGAGMEAYVARHGALPLNLSGVMTFRINKGGGRTYLATIEVKTVMDKVTLETSRRWSVLGKVTERFKDDWILRDLELDFSRSQIPGIEALREAFFCLFQLAVPATGWDKPGPRFAAEIDELISRFRDMYGAIEAVMGEPLDVSMDNLGDFRDSADDKIVVDVEYDRSLLTAQSFRDYFREHIRFNRPATVDAEVRVTDRRRDSDGETLWSLYRKDGVWSIVTAVSGGASNDSLTPTAEDVRSHVYWHVIREINPDDQEQALAKSQYAADLFTAVETELALHTAGTP